MRDDPFKAPETECDEAVVTRSWDILDWCVAAVLGIFFILLAFAAVAAFV